MTTLTIYKTKSDIYKGFSCDGHAGFANAGKDIVCAAISVLVINCINSMEELTQDKMAVKANEKRGRISVDIPDISESGRILVDSMILGLENIREEYGEEYLTLNYKEV